MPVALKHKAQLYRQLYVGLKSGLPLAQLLLTELLPPVFAPQRRRLARNVQEGRPLASALRTAGIVERWEEQLLTIGENSGRLDSVLADLAGFFETRHRHLAALKAKLVGPGMILLVAILVQPLPALAAGTLGTTQFLFTATTKLLILYAAYRLLLVRPFERASATAFNPLLIRALRHVDNGHWLRLLYEGAYLNLLTLCLESGLDAAQTLKLLRDGSSNAEYRQQHALAIHQVENFGLSLAQALAMAGLIRNTQVFSFLNSSEQSGTLHSDLRLFLLRKQAQTAKDLQHFVKQLALWLYLASIGLVLAGFV